MAKPERQGEAEKPAPKGEMAKPERQGEAEKPAPKGEIGHAQARAKSQIAEACDLNQSAKKPKPNSDEVHHRRYGPWKLAQGRGLTGE